MPEVNLSNTGPRNLAPKKERSQQMDGNELSIQAYGDAQKLGEPSQTTETPAERLEASLRTCGLRFKGGELQVIGSNPLPDVDGALAAWQISMTKPDNVTAQKAYASLAVTTSRRNMDADDLKLQSRIYAKRFMEYPTDIVRDTVQGWSERKDGDWFPSLKDITDVLKAKMRKREMLGDALKGWKKPETIQKRIKLIRFDVSRADMGHTPKGCDVPGYMEGLQGKRLSDAMPRYKADMENRIKDLEALL